MTARTAMELTLFRGNGVARRSPFLSSRGIVLYKTHVSRVEEAAEGRAADTGQGIGPETGRGRRICDFHDLSYFFVSGFIYFSSGIRNKYGYFEFRNVCIYIFELG